MYFLSFRATVKPFCDNHCIETFLAAADVFSIHTLHILNISIQHKKIHHHISAAAFFDIFVIYRTRKKARKAHTKDQKHLAPIHSQSMGYTDFFALN